ncbi:pyridoxal-phosphate dependent enzyme [Anaerophaga thermohalophila]|jgi:threonine dehydratase|uniref:pyridoxal-phosphate dependent enzyme n=1 Tax=Anaerophaga thermohalophila TaxID=177400 RepID=UPI000474889E|nr:pyridoxal-phosphate dependent enzyme [Anaerophaga thermohalophila]
MSILTFSDIKRAHERISPFITRTPVVISESLNKMFGAQLYFKCENQQRAGAFKFRGATNAVQNLNDEEAVKGVATHSSGNHAAALSLAARNRNIPAYIVMPRNAPQTKIDNVRSFDGKITFCEPTLEAREEGLKAIVNETGATFIHPYDCFDVICGQGTAALEMIEDYGPFDIVMTPVGGGGLLSGTAIVAKHLIPDVKVIAGEPANADDACRSLKAGYIVPSENPDTIADGLKTSLGKLNFLIISRYVDEIKTASEQSIRAAMILLRKQAGIFAEPSSAVPLAAMIENRDLFRNKKIGMIISGGNISEETFSQLTKEAD